jgi:hypothetical protein
MEKRGIGRYKPGVSRENLLLIAGLVWTVAGGILGGRGLYHVIRYCSWPVLRIVIATALGVVFYGILFARISGKHIRRIRGLNIPYPCAFSFFNLRSYLMMGIMITGGILLRHFEIIPHEILFTFYITMGVPLLMSASRFFYFRFMGKEVV